LKQKTFATQLLESYHADPTAEIHLSLQIAQDMNDSDRLSLLSGSGGDNAKLRSARNEARRSRIGQNGKGHKTEEALRSGKLRNIEGMHHACERHKAIQKPFRADCGAVERMHQAFVMP
jgi:hypothetical protein